MATYSLAAAVEALPPVGSVLDAIVPISRFDNGEASRIFGEVRDSGCKVVVENDAPACVLMTPEQYQKLVELLDDQYLLALAEERERNGNGVTYSAAEVYAELDIEADDDLEVEID